MKKTIIRIIAATLLFVASGSRPALADGSFPAPPICPHTVNCN